MASPMTCNDKNIMIRLWIHENMRVFHDRLATNDDWEWLKNYILELIEQHFKEKFEYKEIYEDWLILFGDYMKWGLPHSDWKYDEV